MVQALEKGSVVAVVGSGAMGSGIAQVAASAGHQVRLYDTRPEAVAKAIAGIGKAWDKLVEKGRMGADEASLARERLQPAASTAELKDAALVVEAIVEDLEVKRGLFAELEDIVAPGCILATNTSSISVTAIAARLKRPERLVGMHFFNPVPLLPLVEIIRGIQTSAATIEAVRELTVKLDKSPISVKNAPGFVVNRILVPMINEAFFVLAEGIATAEEIDLGMRLGANHPIGPLALADLIGLDVCLSVLDVFLKDFGDSKYRASPLLRELVAAGRLGRKVGQGVYRYD